MVHSFIKVFPLLCFQFLIPCFNWFQSLTLNSQVLVSSILNLISEPFYVTTHTSSTPFYASIFLDSSWPLGSFFGLLQSHLPGQRQTIVTWGYKCPIMVKSPRLCHSHDNSSQGSSLMEANEHKFMQCYLWCSNSTALPVRFHLWTNWH